MLLESLCRGTPSLQRLTTDIEDLRARLMDGAAILEHVWCVITKQLLNPTEQECREHSKACATAFKKRAAWFGETMDDVNPLHRHFLDYDSPQQDPNYRAYETFLANPAAVKQYHGQVVAFVDGKFAAASPDRQSLLNLIQHEFPEKSRLVTTLHPPDQEIDLAGLAEWE